MGSLPSITINSFIGMNKSKDALSLIPGQLRMNRNYLYMANGGLEERGGGALLKAPPSAGTLYSLSNFKGASGTSYLITNQGTLAYYYTSAWNALGTTLTTSLKTRWAEAGFTTNRAIYGVNGADSITKIIEVAGTPTSSAVSGSPSDATDIILHKNRLFALAGDNLYFTEALSFDDWDTTSNSIKIAPGVDGLGQKMEVWGDALFVFKENGVYVLPNADDITPKLNWVVLRTDAATGTQSPDTVKRTRAGIFYYGTDNTVRILSPSISFSTGEYTLGGSGSPIISEAIRDDLEEDIDRTRVAAFTSIVFKDLYILSAQSSSAGSDYNDLTYFCDTTKWIQWPGIQQPQPYWGQFTGFDYQYYAKQIASGREKLYGAKGLSVIGQVHETLNETVNNDNGNGIDAYAILGWFPIGDDSTFKNIKQLYVVADTESWDIQLKVSAYKYRQSLPEDGEGLARTFSTANQSVVGVVGTAVVGTSTVGNVGVSSNRIRFSVKGYYFKIEFRNQNADELTRINKVIVYYRNIKNK